jgi:antitoxin HigA-1
MAKKMKPIHPGEHLREDFMKPLGLSANRLAMDLHVPATRIGEILAERRGITADTAIRLGLYFKMSPEFWLRLQMRYDLDVAEDENIGEIKKQVRAIQAIAS